MKEIAISAYGGKKIFTIFCSLSLSPSTIKEKTADEVRDPCIRSQSHSAFYNCLPEELRWIWWWCFYCCAALDFCPLLVYSIPQCKIWIILTSHEPCPSVPIVFIYYSLNLAWSMTVALRTHSKIIITVRVMYPQAQTPMIWNWNELVLILEKCLQWESNCLNITLCTTWEKAKHHPFTLLLLLRASLWDLRFVYQLFNDEWRQNVLEIPKKRPSLNLVNPTNESPVSR